MRQREAQGCWAEGLGGSPSGLWAHSQRRAQRTAAFPGPSAWSRPDLFPLAPLLGVKEQRQTEARVRASIRLPPCWLVLGARENLQTQTFALTWELGPVRKVSQAPEGEQDVVGEFLNHGNKRPAVGSGDLGVGLRAGVISLGGHVSLQRAAAGWAGGLQPPPAPTHWPSCPEWAAVWAGVSSGRLVPPPSGGAGT